MTQKTPLPGDAQRRKLLFGAAAASTTLAARAALPAATLLISAASASAQAADPYAQAEDPCTVEQEALCDQSGRESCSSGSAVCGPEIQVVPPFDDEGSDSGDLFFSNETRLENWLDPASWQEHPDTWTVAKSKKIT